MNNIKYYINKWCVDREKYLKKDLYFQIHITEKCQKKCVHCYFNEIGRSFLEMKASDCINFLANANNYAKSISKNLAVDFTGGDPLLHNELDTIIEYCWNNNIKYGFKCNPEVIVSDFERIKFFLQRAEDISLSLDGMEIMHDEIRGIGSFQNTIEAIKILNKFNLKVRISFTASKNNYHEIMTLFDFFINNNIIIDDFTWARYWSENENNIIDNELLVRIFEEQFNYLRLKFNDPNFFYVNKENRVVPKVFFSFKEHQWIPFLIKKDIIFPEIVNHIMNNENSLNCTATKDIFIVDVNGKIFNCRKCYASKYIINNFFDNSEKHLIKNTDCLECIYFNVCGGCYAIDSFTKNAIKCCLFINKKEKEKTI